MICDMEPHLESVLHWIANTEVAPSGGDFFDKISPANGNVLARVAQGNIEDVEKALCAAQDGMNVWSAYSVIRRADVIRDAVLLMRTRREELERIVARESGKSSRASRGEVDAALECGFFFAGEGRRYGGKVVESVVPGRHIRIVRQTIGIGVLITPFNNPAAGIAWKLFPALLCGNAVIIKSHERTPAIALWYARIFKDAGLPCGVLSVLQGSGAEIGVALVQSPKIRFISFTGSVVAARAILTLSAKTLAKVSVETGGKNAFVVCDDADIPKAVRCAIEGAFVDAGQRCAATSRIIIMDAVYEQFKELFLREISAITVGLEDNDMYGAIVGEDRLASLEEAIQGAKQRGANIICGGKRVTVGALSKGFFMEPTVLENLGVNDPIWSEELFGPVVVLQRARDFHDAIRLVNTTEFKLTSAVHTKSMDRAQAFIDSVNVGVVRINGPTHGSEPHVPFGGIGISGNGWREPGEKALDFYSEWKQVSVDTDSKNI